MSRLKKTKSQRREEKSKQRAEIFDELYRMGKSRLQLHEPQIAQVMGISDRTLCKYKSDPCYFFSMAQFFLFGDLFDWSDEDYLDIIRARRKVKK